MGGKVAEVGNTDGFAQHQVGIVFKFDGCVRVGGGDDDSRILQVAIGAYLTQEFSTGNMGYGQVWLSVFTKLSIGDWLLRRGRYSKAMTSGQATSRW